MPSHELLRVRVAEAISVCQSLLNDETIDAVDSVAGVLVDALRGGGKILLCGNGGSAADAQHLAAELVGRFMLDRAALPAIALADNIAAVTAVGNDYGYSEVFARPVRALGADGDVLIGLSTSGASENVVRAMEAAQQMGMVTVAFVSAQKCPIAEFADHVIAINGPSTARIQEGHMLVGHTVFEIVEAELCSQT